MVEVVGASGSWELQDFTGPSDVFQLNQQIAVDKRGNMYWAGVPFSGAPTIYSTHVTGRFTTGIATSSGTGKTKLRMDTFNHSNVQLETFSSGDVLQSGVTSWSYGGYGRRDVDVSLGPDGSARILQQLDFNGTTSAAVSVLVRNDAGTLTSSSATNVTNYRAVKITTGSDNKSYVLLRSSINGDCQVWRMSNTGAFEASATFKAQANKIPAGIAVDGTSIVYLLWQGLDGQIYPWRLSTALAITTRPRI